MPRPQQDPLRSLTPNEHAALERLAVAAGQSFTDAALVTRFNRAGLAALTPGHGGGQPKRYSPPEQERILREVRRAPDRDTDQTGTWSLAILQRALRQAPDGLPTVSTYTIWQVLHDAGLRWQRDRSWCETGASVRQRKSGAVLVHDPDAVAKKT